MKKFVAHVWKHEVCDVIVEANSKEEATEKLENMIDSGEEFDADFLENGDKMYMDFEILWEIKENTK